MATERIHTYCSMCVSRCGVLATVEDGRLTKVTADPEHPNGCICVKGTAAPEIVSSPDRLHYPMRRTRPKGEADPGWVRISWEEALGQTARRLLDIKARYGPEAVVFSRATPTGSASHDFMDWLERLANAFGSPNVLTTTHICIWNRIWGAKYTYGVPTPAGLSPSPDEEQTRCMLLWGVNPQATAPSTALRISRARARGAKLIVIDPRQHSLAAKADCWLRVRPGSDGALAMIHVLLEEELYDAPFVRAWTNGPFLVREDTHQLLMAQDLVASGKAGTFVVWDGRSGGPVGYHPGSGYAQDGVEPALVGTFALALADGKTIACWPAFELLKALAAQPDFRRQVDRQAVHSFLAFNSIPAPLTIFTAARKLAPGHLLSCTAHGAEITRYARPGPRRPAPARGGQAGQLPHPKRHSPTTRVPTSRVSTPGPTLSTTPEYSCPGTIGYAARPVS